MKIIFILLEVIILEFSHNLQVLFKWELFQTVFTAEVILSQTVEAIAGISVLITLFSR